VGKNLYEILDIEEDASPSRIKSAFLRLKQQYEEDLPESEPRHISNIQYQAINEAFAVLSTPIRRQLYDQRLINDRQSSYLTDSFEHQPRTISLSHIALFLLLVAGSIVAYFQYQHMQIEKEQALQQIQLEQEQARAKQEAAKQAAEEAKAEQEQIKAQRQAAILNEIEAMQNRADSRRYAAEVAQAEQQKRIQALNDQRRLDFERMRAARTIPSGPIFIESH